MRAEDLLAWEAGHGSIPQESPTLRMYYRVTRELYTKCPLYSVQSKAVTQHGGFVILHRMYFKM